MFGMPGFGGRSDLSGGYLPSSGAQESPSTPKAKGVQKSQSVVPITIAYFHKALSNSDIVKIADKEIGLLAFIGVIRKVDVQSTVHIYEIDDMTGPCLTVKRWLEENNPDENGEPPPVPLMENTYARVIGVPRKVHGQVFLLGINLSPVTDLNQLTQHLLEVVHAKLILIKDKNEEESANSSVNVQSGMDYKPFQDADIGNSAGIDNGLPKEHQMVLALINSCTEQSGCSRTFLQTNLKLSLPVLNVVLASLCDEGHVYTTMDDDHFRGTYQS